MTVVIRTDASAEIGSGHVARCAVLAQMAVSRGHRAKIVGSGISPELATWLQGQGLDVVPRPSMPLETDSSWTSRFTQDLRSGDWLVVDHYGLDASWELSVDRGSGRLLVIDDLANRPHVCDALLDVGMHVLDGNPYAHLVPDKAQLFFGPGYALVREEFDKVRPRQRSGAITRILVYLGGGSNSGAALQKIARALEIRDLKTLSIVFLASPGDLQEISIFLERNPEFKGISPMVGMADLLDWADLVIGTCGTSTWERLLLGVPSVCLTTADNQRSDAELLATAGAIVNLGDLDGLRESDISKEIGRLLESPSSVRAISEAGRSVMEGRADARRQLFGLFADPH